MFPLSVQPISALKYECRQDVMVSINIFFQITLKDFITILPVKQKMWTTVMLRTSVSKTIASLKIPVMPVLSRSQNCWPKYY